MKRLSCTAMLIMGLAAMSACNAGGSNHDLKDDAGVDGAPCGPPQCRDGSTVTMDMTMMSPHDLTVVDMSMPADMAKPQCPTTVPPTRDTTDCQTQTPICANQHCRPCQTSAECGKSSLCWTLPSDGVHQQGQCIDATTYVDITNASCANGNGSPTMPYCEIQKAIDTSTATTVIQVAPPPANQPYAALTVSSKSVVIFSPMDARDAATPVVIGGVNVGNTGYAVLSDVEILGGGAVCDSTTTATPTARLGLNRTIVLSSSAVGVEADSCSSLVVNASLIALSAQEGLLVGTSTKNYQVTNSVIVLNNGASVTTVPGVYLSQASSDQSTLMFAFNTVADNGMSGSGGGISCGSLATVLHSIVANNKGTQISGCNQLGKVVTAGPDFTGGGGSGALIAQRYTLKSDSTCCIDEAVADLGLSVAVPAVDYYQVPRPKPPATVPTVGFAEP